MDIMNLYARYNRFIAAAILAMLTTILMVAVSVQAQGASIVGEVADGNTDEPIENADVTVTYSDNDTVVSTTTTYSGFLSTNNAFKRHNPKFPPPIMIIFLFSPIPDLFKALVITANDSTKIASLEGIESGKWNTPFLLILT